MGMILGRPILFTLLLLAVSCASYGQWHLFVGPNADWVRAPTLRGVIGPGYGFQLEGQYTLVDWRAHEDWLPMIRVGIFRQGYQQTMDARVYRVHFNYLTLSPGITYQPDRFTTINASVDVQLLVTARHRGQGNSSSIGVARIYQDVGLAFRSEWVLWSYGVVSPYLSVSHALLPLLKYPRIDAVGNFTGTIRDIWHRTLSLGIRINF